MALISLPHGIGEALGDQLVTIAPLLVNLTEDQGVWWVHHTGSDTYAGLDRYKPFATLANAVSVASTGDIIVLLDGHTETLTSVLSISGLNVVGAGRASGKPTVKLTNNQAAGRMLLVTGSEMTQLLNVWIEEQAVDCTAAKLQIGAVDAPHYSHCRIRGCYIECGAHDLATAIHLSGDAKIGYAGFVEIRDTTIISTATSREAQPLCAVYCDGTGVGPHLLITDGLTVDGGTVGWSNYHAIDFDGAWGHVWMEGVSLPHGSDIHMGYTWGHLNVQPSDGGGRIDWDEALL